MNDPKKIASTVVWNKPGHLAVHTYAFLSVGSIDTCAVGIRTVPLLLEVNMSLTYTAA